MKRVSLDQQIEEVRRELHLRQDVYPRQVTAGKMRQSLAEYHIARLRAALATLEWVKANEAALRALASARGQQAGEDGRERPFVALAERPGDAP